MLVTVDDPVAGPRKYMRTPLHLSAAPEIPTRAAPQLGEHTLPILRDLLAVAPEQIDQWSNEGVIEIWRE
jgi:crotonobetainyl-CoA:carnitine CoA-transferase CaiB-like acyl-CoA transferase